jgi:preprotein translocase subunit SecA
MTGHPPPRPGPLLGAYPEQDVPTPGRLEQIADRVAGAARALRPQGPGRYRRVLRRIRKRGDAYQPLDAAGLDAAVLELRARLRMQGLATAPCIDAFALVREHAARVLGMRPFDVQVLGGWTMLQGEIAEMQTGEGKTLTATLPAATAALAGVPVHVVTVNDYLVQRDAHWMGALYRALRLSVGAIVEGMSHEERRAAYGCDVVYCTNKQLAFDYLRDRLVRGALGPMRLRLDDLYGERAIGGRLLLRGLCFALVDEADSVLVDEARTPLIISRSGEAGDREATYREALALADGLTPGADYRIDLTRREIELTDAGRDRLATLALDKGGVWAGTRRREELVRQALHARELLMRDHHYLVADGKVQIIDEYTGRVMPDRSWARGLHQLVEAKEGCPITAQNETLARISYQRFFRRYLRLGGMTGTAREVVGELWAVYHLGLTRLPTHRPLKRKRRRGIVFRTAAGKWRAVVERTAALHAEGRPVLIGTTSVEASEHLSRLLDEAGIFHRVLNARQDRDEAETIARAGESGAVTVATNMAGRGTDIKLGPGVAARGGLHVIATERHDAGRIDRQLYGRCGRQGDPGSFEYLVSLEDGLIAQSPWRLLVPLFPRFIGRTGPPGRLLLRLAQRGAERRNARIRRQLLKLDEQIGRMLAFSGRME